MFRMSLVGYSNKKKQSQLTVLDHTLAGSQTLIYEIEISELQGVH